MNNLFTPRNVELAAILCGDPNDIHYRRNPYDLQIAAGLQQLVIALDRVKPEKGKTIRLTFKRPIYLPGGAGFSSAGDSFSFGNDRRILTEGALYTTLSPAEKGSLMKTSTYEITDVSPMDADRHSWEDATPIPRDSMQQILPNSDTTDFSIAVLRSIHPFITSMRDDRTLLPEVSFPCAREEGRLALLETGLTIDVQGARTEKFNTFSIKAYSPRSLEPEKSTVYCAEVEGLYTIQIGMNFLPKDKHIHYLERMKKRV